MIKSVTGRLFCMMIMAISLIVPYESYGTVDTAAISMLLSKTKDKSLKESVFLVYNNGKIIYKKEAGEFNAKTLQPIGSASHWLTTALVLLFVQEGKLSLNDKVSDYLPIFSKHGKAYITIGNCLSHNTGIKNDQGVAKVFQKSKFKNLEEEVNDYASKKEIETNPGTEFNYSNMGYNIAARVLEVISKKPLDRLSQEKLFRPLAMRNTTFANENYNDAMNAATGARSTAADYMNFLSMLLNKGSFNGKPFLDEASLKIMFTPFEGASKIKNAPKTMEGYDYGFGSWILSATDDGKVTAASAPSLAGTWPVVDLCHQYAFILFTKETSGDQHKDLVLLLKSALDDELPGNCN